MRPCTDTLPARDEGHVDDHRRSSALAVEIARELHPASQSELTGPSGDAAMRVAGLVEEALSRERRAEFSYPRLLAELREAVLDDPEAVAAAGALDKILRRNGPSLQKAPPRLGVCPAVVFKALSLFSRQNTSVADIEKVTGCDPILATSVLSYANSALYGRSQPVQSVGAAVAYIGMDAAKRVILAASARPLFSSVALRELWQHSVDVAAIAEQLAGTTGSVDPSEAFVAGLIHDVGRLAIELATDDDLVVAHRRLTDAAGCSVWADLILTGQDHGAIGATVLQTWKLPEAMVDAIRYHHLPELRESAMPSILYLAEIVADSAELIPCPSRLEWALKTAKIRDLDSVRSDLRRLGTALALVG